MTFAEAVAGAMETDAPFARVKWKTSGTYVVLVSGDTLIGWADVFGPVPNRQTPLDSADAYICDAEDVLATDWELLARNGVSNLS